MAAVLFGFVLMNRLAVLPNKAFMYHRYKLGEIINDKYIVCGIMKPGAFFYDLRYSHSPVKMDNLVFKYLNDAAMDEIDYGFIISDIKIIADSEEELKNINDYAEKLGLDRFEIVKDSDRIEEFREDHKSLLELELYLLLCIALLTLVLIYIYTYLKIKSLKEQIDLFYLLGATYKELFISILVEPIIHIAVIMAIIIGMYYRKMRISPTFS